MRQRGTGATRFAKRHLDLLIPSALTAVLVATAAGAMPVNAGDTAVRATYKSALTPTDIARLSANPTDKVIVLLKNQHAEVSGANGQRASRAATLNNDQSSITQELATLHAPAVHSFSFVNAVSATVSHAEAQRLATNPQVAAVVPDAVVQGPSHAASQAAIAAASGRSNASSANSAGSAATTPTAANVCPTDPSKPLLEPEALQLMNVDFGPNAGKPAAHDLATGKGVKVAVFPDGLDPNLTDFIRPDGTHAIFDYQDFTGEGTGAVTGGVEAFGDASSIVAQGRVTYNLNGEVNAAFPLPPGCNIRIKGVAPDASLAVMKVFGNANSAFDSLILNGVDWAISHDNVDILSQSFGGNPEPNPGNDPIAVLDADAVAAGITVVASSGDAGTTSTIGTPATNPAVISVGATTSYQLYAQTSSYGYQLGGGKGWESNNVSAFSSSGHTDFGPRTVDVVAPGESGWAVCSPNTAVFTECADIYHGPTPQAIAAFGGTSQSCPLTAGTAALVIQAYRDTHGGDTPSPALVRQILMSTSQDLDITSSNQGAGFVDALRAVQQARSIHTADGSPAATGQSLLYSPTSISELAQPGHTSTHQVTVTNTGTSAQQVTPALRELGPSSTLADGTLTLNPSTDPTFTYQSGTTAHDVHTVHFSVPIGLDRLVSRIAWNGSTVTNGGSTIRADLFDPFGRMAAQSRPQGSGGGFGEDEIHNPAFGTWTLVVFDSTGAPYSGPLHYTELGSTFHNVQNATGGGVLIQPGQSATFPVNITTPAKPGDADAAIVFTTSSGNDSNPAPATIPVSLRSLVMPANNNQGTFQGTITGGNARMAAPGQDLPYQFDVPKNTGHINVDLKVASPGYFLVGILVDPSFSPVDAQGTLTQDGSSSLQTLHLTWAGPTAGRWTLELFTVNGNTSLLTSVQYSGLIRFGEPSVTATGLPVSGDHIASGSTRTATVHVTNIGNSPKNYLVDPRLTQTSTLSLASLTPTSGTIPINATTSPVPQFVVPPFTTQLQMAAESTVPISFTSSPFWGEPELLGVSHGDTAIVTYNARTVAASIWACPPTEFGPGAAVTADYQCGASAITNTFDLTTTSSTGDIWSALEGLTATYSPLTLQPGQSGDITVTFAPTGNSGDVVSGFLAVESFDGNNISSDQYGSVPYQYTIGK